MWYGIVYIFMIICAVFYPPALLCMESYKAVYHKKKLNLSTKIMCFVPLLNLILIRKLYYDKARVHTLGVLTALACFTYRALAITLFYSNEWLVLISSVASVVGIVVTYLLAGYTALDVAICTRKSSYIKILCVVFPPAGAYIVARGVVKYLRSVKDDMEGTFDGQ